MADVTVIQDADKALEVLREVGAWLQETGLNHSSWWEPKNLNWEFLRAYAQPEEFYVAVVEGEPAAAAIIQPVQTLQDWSAVDHGAQPKAMYVHYVAVRRKFAGQGLAGAQLDQAAQLARAGGLPKVRLDTDATEAKLRAVYEKHGFKLVMVIDEPEDRKAALYEKLV